MLEQIDQLYQTLDPQDPLFILATKNNIQIKVSSHYLDFIKGKKIIRTAIRHLIYSGDMVNSFDYYFGAVKPIKFSQFSLVDYSLPKYHDVLGFELMPVFFTSLAEPVITTEQYLNFANLKTGSTVLDLGAYSGLTSIIFKEQVGSQGRVIALDADQENITAIEKNLALYNKITGNKVDLFQGAIWKHNNGLSFSTEGNMGSSASEIVGLNRGAINQVRSFTLSALAESAKLHSVDFIKCDVEGAEAAIFEDTVFFEKYNPKIIIETHLVNNIETTEKCIGDLQKFGYTCKRINQTGVPLPLIECYPKNSNS
jgi:FkbM family methyltransferase